MDDDSNERTYSANQIEQLLRCSVCLDTYNQPKLLPCQHTYCQDPCLEGLINYFTRKIKCPDCRAEHAVPYQGVSAFPNNLSIMAFLDLASAQSRGGEQRRANEPPAAQRQRNNERPPAAIRPQEEAALANADVVARNNFAGDGPGCPSCGSDRRLSSCLHCEQSLCEQCKRLHLDQLKLEISRLVTQIRRGLPKLAETLSTVEQSCEQVRQHGVSLRTEINDSFERYIRNLKSRQRLIMNEAETSILGELRSIRFFQENLEVEIASTASFCDSTETTLERSNHNAPDQDLIDIRRRCTEHMDNIRLYETGDVRIPRARRIQFQMQPQLLSSAINVFGEIQVNLNTHAQSEDNASPAVEAQPEEGATRRAQSSDELSDIEERDSASQDTVPEINIEDPADEIHSISRNTPFRLSASSRRRPLPSMGDSSRSLPASLTWDEIIRANTSDDTATPSERRSSRLRDRTHQHVSDSRLTTLLSGSDSPPSSVGEENRFSSRSTGSQGETSTGSVGSPRLGRRSLRQNRALPDRPSRALEQATLSATPRLSGALHSPSRLTRQTRDSVEEESASPNRSDDSLTDNGTSSAILTRDVRPRVRPPARFSVGSRPALEESSSESDNAVTYSRISGGASAIIQVSENNYLSKERAVIRFGERGTGENQFTWPRGLAVSPVDDTIVVCDSSNHRVVLYDSQGQFIRSFGSYGSNEGDFDCPAGVAVNSLGQIIVSDRYNHRIQIFDSHGHLEIIFGSEGRDNGYLNYPWGVAVDRMGFLYICDKENHRVQVYQSNGTYVRKFGRCGTSVAHFENPHYLAVSPENEIYVCDTSNHRIQVFTSYGEFLFSFGCEGTGRGQLKNPKGIAIDHEGFVIVGDSGNSRVQVFRGDGRHYTMFGAYGSDSGEFKAIEGVAVLSNGNIVVSDRENHRIQIL